MIHASHALVLQFAGTNTLGLNAPTFFWRNVISAEGITADFETEDDPATNLANALTNAIWVSSSAADQSISFSIPEGEQIDSVCFARHNFGSARVTVSVKRPDPDNPGQFIVLHEQFLPANDRVFVLMFPPTFASDIVIGLEPAAGIAPSCGVVFIGKSLRVTRGLPPPHLPINLGFDDEVESNVSQRGEFLGSIVLSQGLGTSISFDLLNPEWFLDEMEPFVMYARDRSPFFWAWAPTARPTQVGYCWCTSAPRPSIDEVTELYSLSLQVAGLSL